jgi:DNA-repair protein XRCC3
MMSVPALRTALAMSSDPSLTTRLSLGCAQLDSALGGGVRARGITEIAGESATGKTQFCLTLLLQCVLPVALGGLGGAALYICTEGDYPAGRLRTLGEGTLRRLARERAAAAECAAAAAAAEHAAAAAAAGAEEARPPPPPLPPLLPHAPDLEGMLQRIFVERAHTIEAQLHLLEHRLPLLLQRQQQRQQEQQLHPPQHPPQQEQQLPVRLVVVDSIAAMFRGEFGGSGGGSGGGGGGNNLVARAAMLHRIGHRMSALSHAFSLPFVVINQVNDVMSSNGRREGEGEEDRQRAGENSRRGGNGGDGGDGDGDGRGAARGGPRCVAPALGLTWSHCVNARVMLSRCVVPDLQAAAQGGGSKVQRELTLVFSPSEPAASTTYEVTADCVRGC